MTSHHHRSSASLLTWRGLQSWSVGSRASGLCKFFIRVRARPKLRLARLVKVREDREASSTTFFLRWLANVRQKQQIKACLPGCLAGSNNDLKRGDSAIAASTYRKVEVSNQRGKDLPKIIHLGSHGSDGAVSCLRRRSSCLSSDSPSESSASAHIGNKPPGSPALLSSRLKGTCARIVNAAQQYNEPCICELVTGNQFLMHLTAAPVTGRIAKKKANLSPSSGLANAQLRQRDSDTSDRIVFFQQ